MVYLATFGPVDRGVVMHVQRTLSRFLGLRSIEPAFMMTTLELPPDAFNAGRQQTASGPLLRRLQGLPVDSTPSIVVGIVDVDLHSDSRPGLSFIFGEARIGCCCIVSIARLRPGFYGFLPNPEMYNERITKEVLHETGHVLGLGHCADPLCVMHFSETIHDTDLKHPAPCLACSSRLQALIVSRLGDGGERKK